MRKLLCSAILVAGIGLIPVAAAAQSAVEGRVDRLESEMRAVQRKVFPGGAGQTFQPEIVGRTPLDAGPGIPATNPVTDLEARVNALESQMSGLTGQVEITQHRVQILEDDFNAYKRSTDVRLKALEGGATSIGLSSDATPAGTALGGPTTITPPPIKAAPKPSGDRLAAISKEAATGDVAPVKDVSRAKLIAAVEKPTLSDPAENGYTYGYRLWAAKLYPEAERQLKATATAFPQSKFASYAQNLLGRAYLDEGKPSLATLAFYDNYRKNPDGERAPDSLYYLAQSLVQLKKPTSEVCKVYDELNEVYANKMSPSLQADVTQGRADSKCK